MIRNAIRKFLGMSDSAPPADQHEQAQPLAPAVDIDAINQQLRYLRLEVSKLSSTARYLVADRINDLPLHMKSMQSFDYQWEGTEDGNWIVTRPELKNTEPLKILEYTQLQSEWFKNKRVLDAGCGSGRFSWSMAALGANLVAVDQSISGVAHTKTACAEFGDRVQVYQHDLKAPLTIKDQFDLVWSFGVLHHTGDTYTAFKNIARYVRPGGYIFLMLYGEPDGTDIGTFAYYAEVEELRRHTAGMSFPERYAFLSSVKGDEVGGWFDAVSPAINDTYSFYEIVTWLENEGFTDIKRTLSHPNHHVIARRG